MLFKWWYFNCIGLKLQHKLMHFVINNCLILKKCKWINLRFLWHTVWSREHRYYLISNNWLKKLFAVDFRLFLMHLHWEIKKLILKAHTVRTGAEIFYLAFLPRTRKSNKLYKKMCGKNAADFTPLLSLQQKQKRGAQQTRPVFFLRLWSCPPVTAGRRVVLACLSKTH